MKNGIIKRFFFKCLSYLLIACFIIPTTVKNSYAATCNPECAVGQKCVETRNAQGRISKRCVTERQSREVEKCQKEGTDIDKNSTNEERAEKNQAVSNCLENLNLDGQEQIEEGQSSVLTAGSAINLGLANTVISGAVALSTIFGNQTALSCPISSLINIAASMTVFLGETISSGYYTSQVEELTKDYKEFIGIISATTTESPIIPVDTIAEVEIRSPVEIQRKAFESLIKERNEAAGAYEGKAVAMSIAAALYGLGFLTAITELIIFAATAGTTEPIYSALAPICIIAGLAGGFVSVFSLGAAIFGTIREHDAIKFFNQALPVGIPPIPPPETTLNNQRPFKIPSFELTHDDILTAHRSAEKQNSLESYLEFMTFASGTPYSSSYRNLHLALNEALDSKQKQYVTLAFRFLSLQVANMGPLVSTLGKLNPFNIPKTKALTPLAGAVLAGIITNMGIGLLGTGLSIATAAIYSGDQQRIQQQVQDIEDIAAKFERTTCSNDDTNSAEKPICFCTNFDGSLREDRVNSATCKASLGRNGKITPYGDIKRYGIASDKLPQGCVDSKLKNDPECRCLKNKKCYKAPKIGQQNFKGFGSIHKAYGLSSNAFNAFTQGRNPRAELATLNRYSAALKKSTDKQLEKFPKLKNKIEKTKKRTNDSYKNILAKKGGSFAEKVSSLAESPLKGLLPSKIKKDIDKAESKRSSDVKVASVAPVNLKNDKKSIDFDFDVPNEGSAVTIENDLTGNGHKAKSFDYGDKDINNSKTTSIFKIISLRYARSGFRRVFEGDNSSKRQKSNKTDISK